MDTLTRPIARGILLLLGLVGGVLLVCLGGSGLTETHIAASSGSARPALDPAAVADFDASYKTAPPFAFANDVITYTVVAINNGTPVTSVTLSEVLPVGTEYLLGSCSYTDGSSTLGCGSLGSIWDEGFSTGDRITTTFRVRVTAGTLMWPLVNCATIHWNGSETTVCATTQVNVYPESVYLPLALCNYAPGACIPQVVAKPLTGPESRGIALDTAGRRAFIAYADGITVLDMDSYTVVDKISLPGSAYGIAYDADRDRIWVARFDADRVTVIDAATKAMLANHPTSDRPRAVAYNPTDGRMYVSIFGDNKVNMYDAATIGFAGTLGDVAEPAHVAVNPATNKIYVANHGLNGQVSVIDGDTLRTTRINAGLFDAFGITVDTDRNLVYAVSIMEARLAVIDGATDQLLETQDIRHSDGQKPTLRAIAINPNSGPAGRLFLVSSGEFQGYPQLLTMNGWPTLGIPTELDIAPYPAEGIAVDTDGGFIWVTSPDAGLTTVLQDCTP